MKKPYELKLLKDEYVICSLPPDASVPDWASSREFFTMIRTPQELTLICEDREIPLDIPYERGWRAFYVEANLDFDLVGIMASIINPLAEYGVSIFSVSTYRTDYILIKKEKLDIAINALQTSGYSISRID